MAMVDIYVRELSRESVKIIADIRKQRNSNIKIWIHRATIDNQEIGSLIRNYRDIKFIDDNCTIDNSVFYISWNFNQLKGELLTCGLKWVISRSEQIPFCVLSQSSQPNKTLVMFIDANHLEHLPDRFIKVPCFSELSEIIEYCQNKGAFSFSLVNIKKFIIAPGVSPVQGAKVYEEISSRRLWYIDMLHRTHYEVFDLSGKNHLGEANLNGEFDASKKDRKKQPIK